MTDTEKKAHDIAVAIAACAEQAKQNALTEAAIQAGKDITISIDTDSFISVYQTAYEKAVTALEQ